MGNTTIYDLLVNGLSAPMGIDKAQPVFSWKMQSSKRGAMQSAYCITVSDENGSCVWDTGWVESDRSVGIRYQGKALQSAAIYRVTVKIKDGAGLELPAAETTFETGFFAEDPLFPARWITINEKEKTENLPIYRKSFSVGNTAKIGQIIYLRPGRI